MTATVAWARNGVRPAHLGAVAPDRGSIEVGVVLVNGSEWMSLQ